jgi:uncharacterized damage-inducible protein DinB
MAICDALIKELNREAVTTRRALERVPEGQLSWRPHAKSMTLGTLALHIAMLPGAIADLVSEPVREAPAFSPPEASSRAQLFAALDNSIATATTRLSSWSDEDLRVEWRMTQNGKTLFALPRIDMLRSVMLNHWYHHRGELVVYLRLLEVPVPAIYGPSADENPFA